MRGELLEPSGRAYEDIDVKVIDARAYLKHTSARYDIITLMNTYTEHNIAYFGEPDFVHTREALHDYLDHLSDKGFLVLEERDVNKRARCAIFRLVNNFMTVLEERGWSRPERHFFIYNVNTDKAKHRGTWYTFIVVKKTPLSDRDRDWFRRWIANRHHLEYVLEQEVSPDMDFTAGMHTQVEYLGGEAGREENESEYSRFLHILPAGNRGDFLGASMRLAPTSDDNPYIFDVDTERREIKRLLKNLSVLCMLIGAVVLAVLIFSRKGANPLSAGPARPGPLQTVFCLLYFVLIGLGYFIVEITLLKFYQSHTGSPTNSLIFILGGLLFFTGAGSYLSEGAPQRRVVWGFAGVALLAAYHIFLGRGLLDRLDAPVWLENFVLSATVAPLGFCMGISFPFGLRTVKQYHGEARVPLFVAVNSLASAFAIGAGLFLCVSLGFRTTALIGVGCYACALPAILFVRARSFPRRSVGSGGALERLERSFSRRSG